MVIETELLERAFSKACTEVGLRETDILVASSLLAPLKEKSPVTHAHYLHSLRVGLVARAIGKEVHLDEKVLLLAGVLHDIGKALVPIEVLGKNGAWTAKDQRVIRRHVMDGYRMLRGRFDFSAEVMLWHHRFQVRGYPRVLPRPLHGYSTATKALIVEYGRMLALSDVYDALHRPNDKFKTGAKLSGTEIREKMLEFNPDRKPLIEALYEKGVLTVD